MVASSICGWFRREISRAAASLLALLRWDEIANASLVLALLGLFAMSAVAPLSHSGHQNALGPSKRLGSVRCAKSGLRWPMRRRALKTHSLKLFAHSLRAVALVRGCWSLMLSAMGER